MSEGTLKTLEKMTRTKLIEEAHKYPDIVGAHGLSKEELVETLSKAMKASGEWVEEQEHDAKPSKKKARKPGPDKATLKAQMNALKKKRVEASAAGDRQAFVRARAKVKRLKGRLRRLKAVVA